MNKLFLIVGILFISMIAIRPEIKAQRAQSVYAELFGNGLIFSLNYDTRLFSKPNGLGIRGGFGYIGGKGDSNNGGGVITIPIQANWLLGKDGKYFEIGAGPTIIIGTGDLAGEDLGNVVGSLTFGYRKQPEDGGFMWRIGITPLFNSNFFFPYWAGGSIGYAF